MKVCSKCGEERELKLFKIDKRNKSGRGASCKPCNAEDGKVYHTNNKEAINIRHKKDYNKKKYVYSERHKEYYHTHKSDYRLSNAKRRAIKLQAKPKWADDKYISLFYQGAVIEAKRTGKPVEVDHIIPLQGKLVCGYIVKTISSYYL